MTSASPPMPRLASHARLGRDPVGGGPVLLYPEGILELGPTAEAVLRLCDGTRSVRAIAEELAAAHEAAADQIEADIVPFLSGLEERSLLKGGLCP